MMLTVLRRIAAFTRDEGLEIIHYEKAKIELGLESLRRVGLRDESLKRIRLMAAVTEQQGPWKVE